MKRLVLLGLVVLTACSGLGGGGAGRVGLGTPEGAVLCGDSRLRGEAVGMVEGAGACGIDDAVRVRWVAGVRLSSPATLNCRTARTLADWTARDARRSLRRMNMQLAEMRVAASYSCRGRNGQPGARMSEHALGNAIDFSAFTLANGTVLNVQNDWNRGRSGRALRRLLNSACGRFGTVLGPESDAFHLDHFHFDTARHRGGPYCR